MPFNLPIKDAKPRPAGYVTYAVFTVPSPNIPGGAVRLQPVQSRAVETLDIPADASAFYFCDAPANLRDPLRSEINISTTCFIAREIITAEQLRARLLASGVLKSLGPIPATRDAQGNLTEDVVRHAVWLSKCNSADYHAVGRNGEISPLRRGQRFSVIAPDRRVLLHWRDDVPRRLNTPQRPAPKPPADRKRFKL